ncbi:S8 family peptidase [Ruminiclostridium cellulolyticum]|uniref:Peptidase S8 and S53 subtilisin kexin sedolisin n=1 Tax=Ruminiclostridium cellulolyticum (strain ATCC 35319 / DSM 5812 / JCM 6584 / H10) TaxID=394503 RepID=B8I0G0_RUMCH|nr:S8 family serine peptidase [Ruminiclostridium cellulolyticum]ACL77486.1 peptidase S8 and S53 subtilisin kexin sedolisin [Ruminiclostridium cellulolyticum H10]
MSGFKKFLVIPFILIFLAVYPLTSYVESAETDSAPYSLTEITKLQIIKEVNGVKLAKAIFNNQDIKDIVIFKDGSIEEYSKEKHGKLFEKDKLSKKLKEKIKKSSSDEEIPVAVHINDIDHNEVEKYVKDKLKIKDIKDEKPEKIKEYIKEKRIKSKEEYKKSNSQFVKEYINNEEELFESQYSPLIIIRLTNMDIEKLSKNMQVQEMDLFVDSTKEEDTYNSIPNINSKYVKDNLNLRGDGVPIGILEVGYPNLDNTQLTDSNIIFDVPESTANRRRSTHATIVTSIIVGQTEGIAPGATAYVATASSRLGDYEKIEWLIDQGVYVINYSAGYSDVRGEYTDMAKWIDHISIQHDVIFVKSSGNKRLDNLGISDPGMAYNAFTVGSMNDNDSINEPNWLDDIFSPFSCYTENENSENPYPFKPDLTAPGESVDVAGYLSQAGTSISAPHVTGVLAQMLGAFPNIFPRNSVMKAVTTAATLHKTTDDYGIYSMSPSLSDKEGAGVIDALSIYNCLSGSHFLTENLTESQFPYIHNIGVNADDTQSVRVSLSWLKNNIIPDSSQNVVERELSDLDLEVFDPEGNQVGYSMSANNNLEVVEFTPTMSGEYKIMVEGYALTNDSEQISLAWTESN